MKQDYEINRHPARCCNCNTKVRAGAGRFFMIDGKGAVRCNICTERQAKMSKKGKE